MKNTHFNYYRNQKNGSLFRDGEVKAPTTPAAKFQQEGKGSTSFSLLLSFASHAKIASNAR